MSELIDTIFKYQAAIGSHHGGSLGPDQLNLIEWYLQSYFSGKEVRSLETGCGSSTIVFAQYASRHTTYCFDDRGWDGSSVTYVCNFPGFRQDNVEWVYGPTQQTVWSHPLTEPVDILLLDGPHGYPFPDLEYFAFYSCLKPGGILIIDDIHIPTIHNLYQFLRQDDSFRPREVTLTTAFLERTERPPFSMDADDWWLQGYNSRSFPMVNMHPSPERVRPPFQWVFDHGPLGTSQVLATGFSLLDSPPVTDGALSTAEIHVDTGGMPVLYVDVEIEPVVIHERQGCGVTILVNGDVVASCDFDAPGRRTIEFTARPLRSGAVTVEFQNRGLKPAWELQDWPKAPWFDVRSPNFRLHSLAVRANRDRILPTALRHASGSIFTFDHQGQEFSFFVDQPQDPAQIVYTLGRFHEIEELEWLRHNAPHGLSALDVGAHVGNHTVYFEKVLGAKRVVPIEPDPRAQFLLRTNCALNGLSHVDCSWLALALGATASGGSLVRMDPYDSGATTLEQGHGPITVLRGDDLFAAEHFDLIKIDVAGMELEVLQGLSETIERCQPLLMAEVGESSSNRFAELMKKWHYDFVWQGQGNQGTTRIVTKPARRAILWRGLIRPFAQSISKSPKSALAGD